VLHGRLIPFVATLIAGAGRYAVDSIFGRKM
jgi:hypothetical protein